MTQLHIFEETAMDEYLFITLAKLNADRRRLEREEREALRLEAPRRAGDEHRGRSDPSTWFHLSQSLRRTES